MALPVYRCYEYAVSDPQFSRIYVDGVFDMEAFFKLSFKDQSTFRNSLIQDDPISSEFVIAKEAYHIQLLKQQRVECVNYYTGRNANEKECSRNIAIIDAKIADCEDTIKVYQQVLSKNF